MVYFTLFTIYISFLSCCYGFQVPTNFSSLGDSAIVLCVLAAFGTISLIGACALCFRRKKTFEKLENEAGSPENIKKNEFPIFRALATEINESSAIVPCERNHLSRDNLLNSSDNLVSDERGSLRKIDGIDSSDVILLEKTPNSSQREKSQPRDTIIFETEKKHQSPSSKTPLLYAKNVQSYQEQQPINEQIQQKSASVFLSTSDTLNGFYSVEEKENDDNLEALKTDEIHEFVTENESKEVNNISSNPFFNSTVEDGTVKEIYKDDGSEIESSINDNSEKYQILEEETDGEDGKNIDDSDNVPLRLERQNSKGSNCSNGDKSIEEALRALDIAIGFEEDDDLEDVVVDSTEYKTMINIEEIKEEATFLVNSIVNDCEKIIKQKQDQKTKYEQESDKKQQDSCFEEFLALRNQDISTPYIKSSTKNVSTDVTRTKLFSDDLDLSNETFQIQSNQTFDVSIAKDTNKTYDAVVPIIKIDKEKEEVSSEDLTTVTPVNTPIELSYSSETWNEITYCHDAPIAQDSCSTTEAQNLAFNASNCGEITFNTDGWYLHSQTKNNTFDICEDDEEEGNMEDMSSTFDQLRRQLTEMLPHAQGMSAHNDFLDDDDLNKDSNSPSENYGIKYGELDEATNAETFDLIGAILNPEPVTELNINYNNYKRPLSPILEESECDETCRTFVLNNETKLLDSTSTGIMESASADALMGQVPKNLMASNDTLFNFEDTLSDPTDILMSPRIHTAGSSTSSTLSRNESHDRLSNERTPTNEELPKIVTSDSNVNYRCQDAIDVLKNNIRQHPLSLDLNIQDTEAASTSKYDLAKMALEEGSWPLELPEAQQIINDLSSPEQNRTADSLSFEQDITYTIDDQKTCVSLILKNDDERISEISEPLFASESLDIMLANDDEDDDKANSLAIDDAISLDLDDNYNFEVNDENGNQPTAIETKEHEKYLKAMDLENFDNDSINPLQNKAQNFDDDSLEPEIKILNEDIEADSIPASQRSKSVYSNDSINDNTVQNSNDTSEFVAANEKAESSDSECSDGKKGSSDIRQVSCNQSVMSTSFTKEWSDDDSSHSSEEFMFVKGEVDPIVSFTTKEDGNATEEKEDESNRESEENKQKDCDGDVQEMKFHEWNIETMPHRKSPTLEDVGESDDESCEESEFIPSSWDQSLQPSKSSLKSPEKEYSLDEKEQPEIKSKRRVAFKIQRYHSVYEYPSEVVQLSPAFSEPQLWSNYLDDCSGNIDYFTYSNQLHDIPNNTIDGFNISSSSRPFHTSVQLHNTWPNENDHDFSWSQFQDSYDDGKEITDAEIKIDWPVRKNIGFDEDDSGLCESSESPLMGELNITKNSLRLPIDLLISSTSSEVSDLMSTNTKELEAVDINNDECFKLKTYVLDDDLSEKSRRDAMPTPLGSMDSLSSNSASSNSSSPQRSFTTFGKEKVMKDADVMGKKSIIFIEDDESLTNTQLDNVNQRRHKHVEAIDKNVKVIIGSSDEDSGFENVKCKTN